MTEVGEIRIAAGAGVLPTSGYLPLTGSDADREGPKTDSIWVNRVALGVTNILEDVDASTYRVKDFADHHVRFGTSPGTTTGENNVQITMDNLPRTNVNSDEGTPDAGYFGKSSEGDTQYNTAGTDGDTLPDPLALIVFGAIRVN